MSNKKEYSLSYSNYSGRDCYKYNGTCSRILQSNVLFKILAKNNSKLQKIETFIKNAK